MALSSTGTGTGTVRKQVPGTGTGIIYLLKHSYLIDTMTRISTDSYRLDTVIFFTFLTPATAVFPPLLFSSLLLVPVFTTMSPA
jgi:hypothetical protein